MISPVRYMKTAFTVSLAFIVFLSIFSYSIFNESLGERYSIAQTINVSGYQRMLSQRIGLYAYIYTQTGSEESHLLAVESLDLMMMNHKLLLSPHNDALAQGKSSPLSAELQGMYFETPLELDAQINAYKASIAQVISFPASAQSHSINTYISVELSHALDTVVKQYEIESTAKTQTLRFYLKLSIIAVIATLFFIAIFINRPMVNRISRYARKNEESIKTQKEYQAQLERLVHFDGLTGLPNRVLLTDRLSQNMSQCQRRNRSLAVVFMDLDDFKDINDSYGHNVGDELLVKMSRRMNEVLRKGDTLARIGGDEFVAIMTDLENIEESGSILERLLNVAADPVTVGDNVVHVSVSIGLTLYPQDDVDADQLIRHADKAMHVAKQNGKNRYYLFDTAKNHQINTQLQSIENICAALHKREFVLYYQPKVNMRTGEVIGVEALIRWQHPERGIISPMDFLPVIEGHVVSLELGEWVIATALSQISQWKNLGVNLPISVNISAYQIQQANFTSRIAALLQSHSEVNPRFLELEILETSALSDIEQVSTTMVECHELGVRFALDDFGTGYSSLTYLKRLPAYLIKIDQSFVRGMLNDANDLAIIEGVVGLAKAFQREVIAEGVETEAHKEALLHLGCELGQGYGIARPMPADDIHKWLANRTVADTWQTAAPPLASILLA